MLVLIAVGVVANVARAQGIRAGDSALAVVPYRRDF